ncbi:sulfatase-like hydrolase/transferase [Chryseolinea sp. T2]|uniref:sulfatase-like hydrolase/transferase n=1 Tax=Chryseolinea sp. T2 TaxID=3129255 RepID=UPI00307861E4
MRKWLLGLCLVAIVADNVTAQTEKPNILWIVSEDNNADMIGCYGNSFATTPNIDRFAKSGVLYRNAFSTAPVCAPSRCTIITGMYPPTLGTDHMRSVYAVPDYVKFFPRYLREVGYYTTNNTKKDYNTIDQTDAWDESSTKATYKNRKQGQPFFAVFNLMVSHESSLHKPVDTLHHDPNKVPLPPYHPATADIKHDWAQYYDKVETMDQQVGSLLKELEEQGLDENTIVFYYTDNGGVLPRSKRFLFESGLHVPLIVRVPQKFKQLAETSGGNSTDRIVTFLDFAPTVLSIAGIKPPQNMQGAAFLGTYNGTQARYGYGFRGRMDERIDLSRTVRDKRYRYVRNYLPHLIYGQHLHYLWLAPSTRSWETEYQSGKLNATQSAFWKEKPAEELYDVVTDPFNIKNLAGNSAYDSVLLRLRKANEAWISATRDIGFIPEAILYELSKEGALMERIDYFKLPRIVETASLASSRNAQDLNKLANRFNDPDASVRYWSAIGCSVSPKAASKYKGELKTMLNDKEGAVQVAAAEALWRMGEKELGLQGLKAALTHPHTFVRVQALNVLQYLGKDAMPALPQIKLLIPDRAVTPQDDNTYDVRAARTFVETYIQP